MVRVDSNVSDMVFRCHAPVWGPMYPMHAVGSVARDSIVVLPEPACQHLKQQAWHALPHLQHTNNVPAADPGQQWPIVAWNWLRHICCSSLMSLQSYNTLEACMHLLFYCISET